MSSWNARARYFYHAFFENEYDTLSDNDKALFVRLLECADPDLFNWLMNHGRPDDESLYYMVKLIQERNRARMAEIVDKY